MLLVSTAYTVMLPGVAGNSRDHIFLSNESDRNLEHQIWSQSSVSTETFNAKFEQTW
jgi:hypothetical protein